MRVTTVNLWNGRASAPDLRRLLLDLRPDVVAAQEVAPDAADVLRDLFPHGRVVGRSDFLGRALVSRWPVDVADLPIPGRPGLVGCVDGIEFRGIHLANPVEGPGAWRMRRRQVEAAVAGLGPRVVVAGDLNATPVWPVHRRLRRELEDGIADWAARTGAHAPATWAPRPWMRAVLRIDHVLVRGVAVERVRVDGVAGCDHRAVTVDLT